MNTLLLSRDVWDLAISQGNIAMASEGYALAQDAASAIKLFLGEYWYDTTLGIPYFEEVLGFKPSVPLLQSLCQNAALTVPEVAQATVYFSSFLNGQLSGQVQISESNGTISLANF